jgi:hypothetical protein
VIKEKPEKKTGNSSLLWEARPYRPLRVAEELKQLAYGLSHDALRE